MGLVGNLEDLGLGDILQIVSLARKSGVLNLSSGEVKGKIIFKDGLVVSALSSELKRNCGLMLVESRVIDQQQLEQILAEAKKTGESGIVIKDFISERFKLPREKIDQVISKEVEDVVFSFFTWSEGSFSFELMEVDGEIKSLKNPWRQFVLDTGLSPQYLAMEGTRLQDERKRKAVGPAVGPLPGEEGRELKEREAKPEPSHPEADFSSVADFIAKHEAGLKPEEPKADAEPRMEESAPLAEQPPLIPYEEKPAEKIRPGQQVIVVIDDEPLMLAAVSKRFTEKGFQVERYSESAPALTRIQELHKLGMIPMVIADLIMESAFDQNLLGGLEILKEVKKFDHQIPVILITDYENQAAQRQAEKLAVNFFFFKPKSSQIDESFSSPELVNFIQLLESAVNALGRALPAAEIHEKAAPTDELFDLVEELRRELGDEDFTIPEMGEEKKSRGLGILRSMIAELNDPSSNGQMTLLVLRFASELMNRAVIFVVTKDQVAGLGQFGIRLNGRDPERQVRKMRIPLDEPSIFQEVMQKRIPLKKKLKTNKWNQYLIERLGGAEPKEVFAAPIITSGKVAAIIYGDNAPEDREIGDTESLEIFLVQVGLAMEKALLERRLRELRREDFPREDLS